MMNLLESGQRNAAPKWEGRKKPAGAKNSGGTGAKTQHKKGARLGLVRLMTMNSLACLLTRDEISRGERRKWPFPLSSGSGSGVGADPPVPSRSIESRARLQRAAGGWSR